MAIGKKGQGQDFNYFRRLTISAASFADSPDIIIPFRGNPSFSLVNEGTGTIEYSFDGYNTHGDLIPGGPTASLSFEKRGVNLIWLRLTSGAASAVRLEATDGGTISSLSSGGGSVSLTGALPSGANTIGNVGISTSLPSGTNTIGNVGINASIPSGTNTIGAVIGPNGTTLATDRTGATAPFAVRISADGTNFVASGTPLFIQEVYAPAAEDNTTGVIAVLPKPIAVNTYAPSVGTDFGATLTKNIKSSAGNLMGVYGSNNSTGSIRWLQLHNTSTVPAVSGIPLLTFQVLNNNSITVGNNYLTPAGVYFSNGIAYAWSTTAGNYQQASGPDHNTMIIFK